MARPQEEPERDYREHRHVDDWREPRWSREMRSDCSAHQPKHRRDDARVESQADRDKRSLRSGDGQIQQVRYRSCRITASDR